MDDRSQSEMSRLLRITRNRVAFWLALLLTLAGLALFLFCFNWLLPSLGDGLNEAARIGLGLLFGLVPAALWLGFFYQLDYREPEPKRLVVHVFLFGALLTAALYQPVLSSLFTLEDWLYEHWWTRLFGGVLVVGFFEQGLVYLAVRYAIFTHPEFDERVDGVIYAIAAGLGLATVLNFRYVVKHGGVDLDIGSIRMVVNALAFASFAGVQGYFLGQARFEKTPIYYLPSGVALAAIGNGFFFFLLERVASGGLSASPWRDLLLATLVAIVTLAVVFWLIARANEETLRLAQHMLASTTPVSTIPPVVNQEGA